MNNRDDYDPLRIPGRRSRRNIEFSDRDFDDTMERPEARGFRDERPDADYDDYHTEDDHRDYYPDEYPDEAPGNYYPDENRTYRPDTRRDTRDYYPRENQASDRDGYRAGYRDGYRDNDISRGGGYGSQKGYDDMDDNRKENFCKRHPVMMNLIYAMMATILAIWMALWFLDFWTFHGQERAVPDVKGQSHEMAVGNISRAGLRAVVTDSVYDSYARPGTVVEQSPIPLAKIKRGGTVYLTLVAYTPKMVTIPDFYDVSERQARSMLEGLGITQVMTVSVPSEYAGLVLGAKFNGVSLRPGAKVPVTAVITLEVGGGMEDVSPDGEIVDTIAIEQTIEALNID